MGTAKALLGCGCPGTSTQGPRGAGQLIPGFSIMLAPDTALAVAIGENPESAWPVGTRALLSRAFPVDRGLWLAPLEVFEFRKMSNGRWLSQPGQHMSFPTLHALAMDDRATIARVEPPPGTQAPEPEPEPKPEPAPEPKPEPAPEPGETSPTAQAPPELEPAPDDPKRAGPTRRFLLWAGGIAGAAVIGTAATAATWWAIRRKR
jgi:hypothetical protein